MGSTCAKSIKASKRAVKNSRGPVRKSDWRETFYQTYRLHGSVTLACEKAGLASSTFRDQRSKDPNIQAFWEDCQEAYADHCHTVFQDMIMVHPTLAIKWISCNSARYDKQTATNQINVNNSVTLPTDQAKSEIISLREACLKREGA